VGGTCPLTIDNFMEVSRISDIGRLQHCLLLRCRLMLHCIFDAILIRPAVTINRASAHTISHAKFTQ
jgi:hypothetical protein